jgi:hypothetical protein
VNQSSPFFFAGLSFSSPSPSPSPSSLALALVALLLEGDEVATPAARHLDVDDDAAQPPRGFIRRPAEHERCAVRPRVGVEAHGASDERRRARLDVVRGFVQVDVQVDGEARERGSARATAALVGVLAFASGLFFLRFAFPGPGGVLLLRALARRGNNLQH